MCQKTWQDNGEQNTDTHNDLRSSHYFNAWRLNSFLLSIDHSALCAELCVGCESQFARIQPCSKLAREEIINYLCNTSLSANNTCRYFVDKHRLYIFGKVEMSSENMICVSKRRGSLNRVAFWLCIDIMRATSNVLYRKQQRKLVSHAWLCRTGVHNIMAWPV